MNSRGRLRWQIGALLFLSTVINYIDRQTLSALGPTLKEQYQWTNADFALIVISFRVAYTLGQAGAGRFLDAVGTRTGLTVAPRACARAMLPRTATSTSASNASR